jgi:hypothetical protein
LALVLRCKSRVEKHSRKRRIGALPRFPSFGLVAQSAERPVVCGRVEGATPFESANLVREPVSRNGVLRLHKKQDPGGFLKAPGRTARGVAATCSDWNRGTAGAIPAALTNCRIAVVAEHMRHPSSKRNDAGGTPAGSAIARWCQSSTTVC